MIYLDYAATTPMSEEALHVFQEAARTYYGNPSSLHDIGTQANEALDICRQQFAQLIGGESDGIYFTSGGSDSNILAIRALVDGNKAKGNHLITTEVEHASVYNFFRQLEKEGYEVTYLPVDTAGHISVEELAQAIREDTILASIQHGNSEIGTVQPVEEIGTVLERHGVIFHADCVQTFGKVQVDVQASHIDSLSVSGHKIYGPKGTGMCYINPRIYWRKPFLGTTAERGLRPGTVAVPSVVAFTAAAQQATVEMEGEQEKYERLRDLFVKKLTNTRLIEEVTIEGGKNEQLPHIIGLSFRHVEGQYVMLECNRYGVAISTGTACQVGQQSPSRTMLAVGKTAEEAKRFIRVSFGKGTTEAHIDEAIDVFERVIAEI